MPANDAQFFRDVLAEGRGFVVDCEARAKNWSDPEADCQRIIASFNVRRWESQIRGEEQ